MDEIDVRDVPDMLAAVTADIDQAQATIDEARSKFKNDHDFQQTLDDQQFQLDVRRERVRIMNDICAQVYNKKK